MKYFFSEHSKIFNMIDKSGICLLALDFDGTLSSIASLPFKASINKKAKTLLKELSGYKNIHIVIISGRSLKDIKNKVGLKGLVYAGNHGQEWEIKGRRFMSPVPKNYNNTILDLRNILAGVIRQYKGVFLENKGIGLAIHYRQLEQKLQKKFIIKINSILFAFVHNNSLSIINGKKVIDIRPANKSNKGSFILHYLNFLTKKNIKPLVIYIGDDATDEDAFKVLKRHITVRVGKKQTSTARYYIRNIKEVSAILQNVADCTKIFNSELWGFGLLE